VESNVGNGRGSTQLFVVFRAAIFGPTRSPHFQEGSASGRPILINQQVVWNLPLRWKYALTRAHTVTLIAFPQSMTKSRLPDEKKSLQINFDTLQFITASTLAKFSSQDAQAFLVELLENVVDGLYHNYGDSPSIVSDIMDVLFDVLGTVGDPPSVVRAKALVNRHLIRQLRCEGALRARHQVIFLISPIVWNASYADCFFPSASGYPALEFLELSSAMETLKPSL
jgi:hypothetical protein